MNPVGENGAAETKQKESQLNIIAKMKKDIAALVLP